MSQLSHKTTPFEKRQFPLTIICDGVQGPANIGSLFRISDAFGVQEIAFSAAEIDLESPRMKRTSRETHKKVEHAIFEDSIEAITEYREAGYLILGLEISSDSIRLNRYKIDPSSKIALVVGNEQQGVSKEALELCDAVVHIEMYGENSSINVSHAAAIALYQITQKLK